MENIEDNSFNLNTQDEVDSPDLDPTLTSSQPRVKKSNIKVFVSIVAIGFILVGLGGYYLGSMSSKSKIVNSVSNNDKGEVACTEDARLCSDGTSVGRIGPNCEFEECPSSNNEVLDNWIISEGLITSKDSCYQIQVIELGQLDDLAYFVAESYSGSAEYKEESYFDGAYKTITVLGAGVGEVKTVFVDAGSSSYKIVVSYSGKGEGSVPTSNENKLCRERESELNEVINSINVVKADNAWQDYTSQDWGFSIQIPQNWRTLETGGGIGFGPKEIMEDILIGVTVYNLKEKDEKNIIDQFGSQFEDRKQAINIISVNGLVATEIITTTPSIEDWYYRAILIENNDLLYVISNGSILDEDIQGSRGVPQDYTFEQFLQSFRLNN